MIKVPAYPAFGCLRNANETVGRKPLVRHEKTPTASRYVRR
jgi:hypothetical protein